MKKIIITLMIIICVFTVYDVSAKAVLSSDVEPSTYIIGKHMYTRNTSSNTGYDGKLTTGRIMLGARTVIGDTVDAMLIYYKTASGKWIDALTGEDISNNIPVAFEIESRDLSGSTSIHTPPNFETYNVNSSDIGVSTYLIGSYIFTRNVFSNTNHENDGVLTTREIMLASKTITGDSEEDMKIYYKTASGKWINALTGISLTPTNTVPIAVIDLINQKEEGMKTNILDGSSFNAKIKELAGNNNITKILKAESITAANMKEDNLISAPDSEIPVYAWFDNGTIYYYPVQYIDNVKIYLARNSSNMFKGLSALTTVDLSIFDTSKVISMANMFSGCSSLATLDLSTFNTSALTNMRSMFAGCEKLTSINLSSFNTTNVTDMYRLFFNCEKLTTLNLSNFITNNVVEMKEMFAYCSSLTSLDLSSFNTSKVVSFEKMFQYCGELVTITLDKTKFITTNSSNMSMMFQYCEKLESVDVSGFDTSNVYDLSYMFSDCHKLLHIDVSNFNTSNVTNMKYMFLNCLVVDELNVSNFDTSKVIDISWMFFDCASIATLDLSSFDLSSVTDSTYMLHALYSLKTIKMPKVYPAEPIEIDKILYDGSGNLYEKTTEGIPAEIFLYNSTYLPSGQDFNQRIKSIAANSEVNWYDEDLNITKILRENNVSNVPIGVIGNEDNIISTPESYVPVYAWYDNGILYYYSAQDTIYLNYNCEDMFSGLKNVTEIDLTGLNTKLMMFMTGMFSNCDNLTTVDLSNFDTSNVTGMEAVFYNCSSLRNLDLSAFDIRSDISLVGILEKASALETLVTPKLNGNATLELPKPMYFENNSVAVSEITSTTAAGTTLKNLPWPTAVTPLCIRATSLHTETCSQTEHYCAEDGYTGDNKTITYGSLGEAGYLQTGDAFDCNTKGTGYNERYYYVTSRWEPGTSVEDTAFDSNTAVLISANNYYNGQAGYSGVKYSTQEENYYGPNVAKTHLPDQITTLDNFIVDDTRNIIGCSSSGCTQSIGTKNSDNHDFPTGFSYAGKAGRLLTLAEFHKACTHSALLSTNNSYKVCNFMLEGTTYADPDKSINGIWLETPAVSTNNDVMVMKSYSTSIYPVGPTQTDYGVKAVIEISKTKISY